jgi:ubiquinone biosynthesis protein UbiJ
LDRKIDALDHKVDALDHKVTTQHAILTQDVRMIRSTIHDMGKTRVTEGEIVALHEDVNRVQQRLENIAMRVEMLEMLRN